MRHRADGEPGLRAVSFRLARLPCERRKIAVDAALLEKLGNAVGGTLELAIYYTGQRQKKNRLVDTGGHVQSQQTHRGIASSLPHTYSPPTPKSYRKAQ